MLHLLVLLLFAAVVVVTFFVSEIKMFLVIWTGKVDALRVYSPPFLWCLK